MSATDQFALAIKQLSKIVATDEHVREKIGALIPELKTAGAWMRNYEKERTMLLTENSTLRQANLNLNKVNNHTFSRWCNDTALLETLIDEQIAMLETANNTIERNIKNAIAV